MKTRTSALFRFMVALSMLMILIYKILTARYTYPFVTLITSSTIGLGEKLPAKKTMSSVRRAFLYYEFTFPSSTSSPTPPTQPEANTVPSSAVFWRPGQNSATAGRASETLHVSKGNHRRKQAEEAKPPRSDRGNHSRGKENEPAASAKSLVFSAAAGTAGSQASNYSEMSGKRNSAPKNDTVSNQVHFTSAQSATKKQKSATHRVRLKARSTTAGKSRKEQAIEHADTRNAGKSKGEQVTIEHAEDHIANSSADVDLLVRTGGPYLLRSFNGRLGNVLFELASAFCIAKRNGLTLVVQDKPQLADLNYTGLALRGEAFRNLSEQLRVLLHPEPFCCSFSPRLMTLKPRKRSHILRGFLQSWKYFEPCKNQVLKRVILFRDDVLRAAEKIVGDLRKDHPGGTLVGLHVRQEDYLNPKAISGGKKVAPPDYYVRAMTYFRNRFRDVTFIAIVSNRTRIENIIINSTSDVTFLARSDSPAVDMEVLSRLDHFIMSVGTFGWWAAYKNKGTVVCYKNFFVPGSKYGKQIRKDGRDFLYPEWISM